MIHKNLVLAKVLIIARPGDSHADCVENELLDRGITVFRTSLDIIRSTKISWTPGKPLTFSYSGIKREIGAKTTIWWRRPGRANVEDLAPDEAQLVSAECIFTLRGCLAGIGARWVDAPWYAEIAENKLCQMTIAQQLGIIIPASLLTNDPVKAKKFSYTGTVIAKPISVGPGVAPFVQTVPNHTLYSVAAVPVLLQRLVLAEADARILTVGKKIFAWRRGKSQSEPVDWRKADPEGLGFEPFEPETNLGHSALRIAHQLRLSTTVQDWLLTNNGPVFLEINPQGQWLFLRHAVEQALSTFVGHLINSNNEKSSKNTFG